MRAAFCGTSRDACVARRRRSGVSSAMRPPPYMRALRAPGHNAHDSKPRAAKFFGLLGDACPRPRAAFAPRELLLHPL